VGGAGGRLAWACGLGLLLLAAGCAPTGPAARRAAPAPQPGAEERGLASWYGHPHHGRRTASGEIFDMHALTAAHRTLPMGTRVLVIHAETGRSVEVRINDRGPFRDGRIIDLSYAAARRLGVVGAGVVPVRVRVIAPPDAAPAAGAPPAGGAAGGDAAGGQPPSSSR